MNVSPRFGPATAGHTRRERSTQTVKIEQLKVVSAAIGAGAAIAMVGLGIASSTVSSAQEPITPGPVTTPEATTGETITTTTPPSTPETTEAKPSIEGPAALPPEEQGLPG